MKVSTAQTFENENEEETKTKHWTNKDDKEKVAHTAVSAINGENESNKRPANSVRFNSVAMFELMAACSDVEY